MKSTWNLTRVLWLIPATAGFAQTDAAPTALPSGEMLTLAELMRMGGWLMYVLAALSVLGLARIA